MIAGDNAVLMISPIPNVVNPPPNAPRQHHGERTADEEPLAAVGSGPHHFEAQSMWQLIHTILSEINNLQTMVGTLAEAREANKVIFIS